MKVRVIRPICINAVRQEPGTVVELPDQLAREAIFMGKVSAFVEAPPKTGPMTTDTAPSLAGKKSKGD